MKNLFKTFALIVLMLMGVRGFSQPIIITDSVIQTSLCAGSNVIIPFTVVDTAGSFNFGNIFTAQLSDQLGGFSNPIDIGSFLLPWTTSGYILGTIPVNSPLFGVYKIRVIGDNPVTVGSDCPNFVVILNTAVLATITATDSVMCEGDSMVLTATPIFQSYIWERNGTSIPGGTSQSVTVTQAGSYTVTVKDTFQCVSTSPPFNTYIETCVGIEEHSEIMDLEIYPVPATDQVELVFTSRGVDQVEVSVYNLLGKEVIADHFEASLGVNRHSLDISSLPDGLYLLKIGKDSSYNVVKIIKN